jgi:hypothetical protein
MAPTSRPFNPRCRLPTPPLLLSTPPTPPTKKKKKKNYQNDKRTQILVKDQFLKILEKSPIITRVGCLLIDAVKKEPQPRVTRFGQREDRSIDSANCPNPPAGKRELGNREMPVENEALGRQSLRLWLTGGSTAL